MNFAGHNQVAGPMLMRQILKQLKVAGRTHFYREKFSRSGLRISKITSLEDFSKYVPLTTSDEIRDFENNYGDPFSTMTLRDARLTLQLDSEVEDVRYVRVTQQDLKLLCSKLVSFWRMFGIRRGDYVSIYDYSTDPVTFLASGPFTGLLKKGVAEILGCVALCNDGLPEFVLREIHVLKMLKPRVIFVRNDLVSLLAQRLSHEGTSLRELGVEKAIVVSNVCMPTAEEMRTYIRCTGIETHSIFEINSALFISADCSSHEGLHVPADMYYVEVVDAEAGRAVKSGQLGHLVITNLFSQTVPAIRYFTDVRVSISKKTCRCGSRWPRLLPEDASFTGE